MFKSKVIIFLLAVLLTSSSIFSQSFTYSGPSSATVGYGNSTVNVTYYFSYSNTGSLTVPKLAIAVDGSYVAGNLCQGADPYLPSSYTFSLAPGSHTLTFKLQSLGSGPDCASSALLWQTETASVNCNFQISVENIFSGGSISVDGTGGRVSPLRRTTFGGDNVSIGAEEQDYGGYHWVWNSSGTNNSEWDRQAAGGQPSPFDYSQNTLYSVVSGDANSKVVAALRKIYHVVLQNSLPEGGGNIGHVIADGTSYNVTAQVPKVEQNTMTIQADNNQPVTNGITSVFNNWSDGNTSSIRTITVGTDLISYTAIYKGKPLTSGRYLHFNDGVYGSPVTLYWNAHPSSNVTGCNIYRKFRVNGVMGNEYLIASVSASTTSYVDNDYTVSNNTTTQLFYDVRYVYSSTLPDNTPYTTESDPNYVNIYGQTVASYNDSQKETASAAQEIPSDYSIENYPNPFNPTTTINYQLPENGFVTIKVYDVLGKEVATLVNENKSAGYYNVNFDASKLTSGVYIYTINANGFAQSKKMLLMK